MVDKNAHEVFAFANDLRAPFLRSREKCQICKNPLESYYCEEKLYIVRCRQCGSIFLVDAPSAETACLRRNQCFKTVS